MRARDGERDAAPDRPADGAREPRWRRRALVPALLSAVGVALLSCDGSVCPPITRSAQPVVPPLRPRYVLATVNGQPLPFLLSTAGGSEVRLVADTLRFTIGVDSTRGPYAETVVVATRSAAGVESLSPSVSAQRDWTRPAVGGALTLAAIGAGGATVAATALVIEGPTPTSGGAVVPQLAVSTADGRTLVFEAR